MDDSDPNIPSKLIIARWTDRFFAWLIDFVVITGISTALIFSIFGTIGFEFEEDERWVENTQYLLTSIIFFAYWTIMEYKVGTTVGKKILNLKTTDIHGEIPTIKAIMISSFGKAFLIPIDVILGWIWANQKRQRIFNKLGNTIVIKIKESDNNITYIKD